MKESLDVGISNEKTVTTTPDMGVAHLGEGPGVFSTPAMIGLMEQTSLESVKPHFDEGEQTVGTMVHVWHRAALQIGEPVTCRAKLVEKDRRKLLFEVEVISGDTKVGDPHLRGGGYGFFVADTDAERFFHGETPPLPKPGLPGATGHHPRPRSFFCMSHKEEFSGRKTSPL